MTEGIRGFTRRPDIVLEFNLPGVLQKHVLVECKRSDDDDYRRDSVYKVFGYLYDFWQLWSDAPQQTPKAIVVFPEQIKGKGGAAIDNRDVALVSADDEDALSILLTRAITG